jgi:uncharacterized protein YcbX
MYLSEIWVYPVKSLGGVRISEACVEDRGLQFDRRWLVVDEHGKFLTQRVNAAMSLIDVALKPQGLALFNRLEPVDQIFVPYEPLSNKAAEVTIWKDTVTARTVSEEADAWLTRQLRKNVRLVAMTGNSARKRPAEYAASGDEVSFADDFPYLVISQASLEDLNSRLEEPVSMKRFRPNFVISGSSPYGEDSWQNFKIGMASFMAATLCERCMVVNIDPKIGSKGTEPLKTLASFRKNDRKILFGRNAVSTQGGIVREGDEVILL